MTTAFKSWRMLESGRSARAKAALQRIADAPKLSRDVHDIAQRALAES
jgi:aminopeptidase N